MEVYNFDQLIRERKKKSHQFKMFDKTYTLPPSLPYAAMLEFVAFKNKQVSETVDDTQLLNLFQTVFGKEIVDSLASHAEFDIEVMITLLQWALQKYGVAGETDTKKGKETA